MKNNQSAVQFEVKDDRLYFVSYYYRSKGLSWMWLKTFPVTDFKPIALPAEVTSEDLRWLSQQRGEQEICTMVADRATIQAMLTDLTDDDFDNAETLEYARMRVLSQEITDAFSRISQPEYLFEKFIQARVRGGEIRYGDVNLVEHTVSIGEGTHSLTGSNKVQVAPDCSVSQLLGHLLRNKRIDGDINAADESVTTRRRLARRLLTKEILHNLQVFDIMQVEDIRKLSADQFRERRITEVPSMATPVTEATA